MAPMEIENEREVGGSRTRDNLSAVGWFVVTRECGRGHPGIEGFSLVTEREDLHPACDGIDPSGHTSAEATDQTAVLA